MRCKYFNVLYRDSAPQKYKLLDMYCERNNNMLMYTTTSSWVRLAISFHILTWLSPSFSSATMGAFNERLPWGCEKLFHDDEILICVRNSQLSVYERI